MITFMTGDMFESQMQTLVNPVNCVGVMGGGLALEFAKRFPKMFEDYKEYCTFKLIGIGGYHLCEDNGKLIWNFPTKDDWRNPSLLEYVEMGLKTFVERHVGHGITSIAFPALGCGLGGLQWKDVQPVMEKYLNMISIPVEIYGPK